MLLRFGKSTHISMISNSVAHLQSYTNSAIGGNSTPTLPLTPRDRRTIAARPAPSADVSASSAQIVASNDLRSITDVAAQTQTSPHRAPTSPHQAPTYPHRAPTSSHWLTSVQVFHDVAQCFKGVSWCFTSGSRCFTMYHNVLHVFHDVLLCLTMFYV